MQKKIKNWHEQKHFEKPMKKAVKMYFGCHASIANDFSINIQN